MTKYSSADDLSEWMTKLPDGIASQPLNAIAIPGSHNSFTSAITNKSKPSPDGDLYNWIRFLPDPIASSLLHPWTVTQDVTMLEQLQGGIRYLDLRVALVRKKASPSKFVLVHGQYGTLLVDELRAIVPFLKDHPKEVVLIDCNHCYEFTSEKDTQDFEEGVLQMIQPFLYPPQTSIPTLKDVWLAGKQVLFFSCRMTQGNTHFWPVNRMVSLWPNTSDVTELVSYLDKHYGPAFHRDPQKWYVHQGVLTPTVSYVTEHLGGSLRTLAKLAGPAFLAWVRDPQRRAGQNGLNVTLLDFVMTDFPDYVAAVIQLNYFTWPSTD